MLAAEATENDRSVTEGKTVGQGNGGCLRSGWRTWLKRESQWFIWWQCASGRPEEEEEWSGASRGHLPRPGPWDVQRNRRRLRGAVGEKKHRP